MPEKMKFYDLKNKRRFATTDYKVVSKKGKKGRVMYALIAKGPSGNECWAIIGKDKYNQLKGKAPAKKAAPAKKKAKKK
jgi:hypothetical protein